jgi:predicted secreted Zn-dependent protease
MRFAVACLLVGAFIVVNVLAMPRSTNTPVADASLLPAIEDAVDQAPVNDADVQLDENLVQQTYKVPGDSPLAIRAFMSMAGPVAANDARHYDSVTNWSLSWSLRYSRNADGCALASARIELAVTEVLPELAQPGDLDPDLGARWQSFIGGLRTHEDGHVERERAGAADLKSAFLQAEPEATCSALGAQLNRLGDDAISRMKLADASWDQETGHGRLQGATFP